MLEEAANNNEAETASESEGDSIEKVETMLNEQRNDSIENV